MIGRGWYEELERNEELLDERARFIVRLENTKEHKALRRKLRQYENELRSHEAFEAYDSAKSDLSALRDAIHYELGIEHGFSLRVVVEATNRKRPTVSLLRSAIALSDALIEVGNEVRFGKAKKKR